jgi:hypothetical protein
MSSSDDLAAKAAQCAKLAQSANTEADRDRWLKMERFWRSEMARPADDEAVTEKFVIDR